MGQAEDDSGAGAHLSQAGGVALYTGAARGAVRGSQRGRWGGWAGGWGRPAVVLAQESRPFKAAAVLWGCYDGVGLWGVVSLGAKPGLKKSFPLSYSDLGTDFLIDLQIGSRLSIEMGIIYLCTARESLGVSVVERASSWDIEELRLIKFCGCCKEFLGDFSKVIVTIPAKISFSFQYS